VNGRSSGFQKETRLKLLVRKTDRTQWRLQFFERQRNHQRVQSQENQSSRNIKEQSLYKERLT
jgi:hypothetical protein